MLEINKIHKGDCLNLMRKIDDNSIQLVLTSPPYNASFRKDNNKYPGGTYEDNLSDEEYIKWSINIFKEYQRILKPTGVIAYNMSYTKYSPSLPFILISKIIEETNLIVVDTIAWKKKHVMPMGGQPNRLTRICEFVYIFVNKDHVDDFDCNKIVTKISKTGQKFFKQYYNFLETKNNDGSVEIHKATYSSDFAKYFIDLYSFKGSLVLDNFMGTGTTAISCIDLDRDWIGMEMCKEYVDYANQRISNHTKNPITPHTPETPAEIIDSSNGKKSKKKK